MKLVFSLILACILCTTGWASLQMPFWETPRSVVMHPWFVATLVDTYLAFFTFWLWVACRESSNLARGIWLLLIFALGNIAMSGYVLVQLWSLPGDAKPADLLLPRRTQA
jgi:hypothetical protein